MQYSLRLSLDCIVAPDRWSQSYSRPCLHQERRNVRRSLHFRWLGQYRSAFIVTTLRDENEKNAMANQPGNRHSSASLNFSPPTASVWWLALVGEAVASASDFALTSARK